VHRMGFVTCPLCGCACSLCLTAGESATGAGQAVGVAPSAAGVWGAPGLCMRGWQVGELLGSSRRLLSCTARRNDSQVQVFWDRALADVSEKLSALCSQDPSALGVVVGPGLTNEEAFAAQALARGVLGTLHVDSFHSTSDAAALWGLQYALAESYLAPGFEELRAADLVLCLNSNLQHLHPRAAAAIAQSVENGAEMLLLDEVDQGLGTWASVHARHLPGAKAAALRCLCEVPPEAEGTESDEAQWPLDREVVRELVSRLEGSRRLAIVFSLAAAGSADAAAMVGQLAVELGVSASRWVGVYALPTGSNAFGVADMLATGQNEVRYDRLSAEEMLSPSTPLRGLLVIGDDLARWVGTAGLAQLRERLETLIAFSAFASPTTELADVSLPLAMVGEREGSMRAADGHVWWNQKVLGPAGEARPLTEILDVVSGGFGHLSNWRNLERIWDELRDQAPGYAGVELGALRRGQPGEIGPRVLSQDTGTAYLSAMPRRAPEPDQSQPFLLLTRYDQNSWAADPRCQGSHLLRREAKPDQAAYCLLSPHDLQDLRIRSGDRVRVVTARGVAEVTARASSGVPAKVAVLPRQFAELVQTVLGSGEVDGRHGGVERAPVRGLIEPARAT